MTHADLVERARRYLLHTLGCGYVLAEIRTQNIEVPDVIGWAGPDSVLVECKANRADFLADKNKPFRKQPELGMGRYRFYMAPAGLLMPDELPKGWGLIEVRGHRALRVHGPRSYKWKGKRVRGQVRSWRSQPEWSHAYNRDAEDRMKNSALRRFELRGLMPEIQKPLD